MTFLLADPADLWAALRTLGTAVANFAAGKTLASELTLDAWVGALGLAVALLAAVEALAGVGSLVWAVTSEVTVLVAAERYLVKSLTADGD